MNAGWSPLPLARAILAEYDPAPLALIYAWKCVYRDDCTQLTDLAYEARRRMDADAEASRPRSLTEGKAI